MKHIAATGARSRDPTDIYYKRIMEMMRDYDLTMQDAIAWDMDGFMPYTRKNVILNEEEEIDYYLHMNYVPEHARVFFKGVAFGAFDYTLEDEEEKAKQKDDGSSSKA